MGYKIIFWEYGYIILYFVFGFVFVGLSWVIAYGCERGGQSLLTISSTNSSKLIFGVHCNSVLALVESPSNSSTSAGRKYFSETRINSLPVFAS